MKKTKKDDMMKEKAFYVEDDVMANNQIHKRTITGEKLLSEFIKFHKRCIIIRDLHL